MLKLTNSMTMEKELFIPRKPGNIKIFTCGPSIYQRPHIGNYRTFLYEDILVRFLEYSGNMVDRIINLTDIEDKSIAEAHSKGEKLEDITSDSAGYFKKETDELHIKLPKVLPSSSSTLDEAAKIIKTLIDKGLAYKHADGIFFDPLKVKGFGKLYGLDMSKWPEKKVRFKKDTYNGNRWNRGDFILWHPDKGEHIHFWDSVVGRGRPSWNIQDPAIIHKHLGEQVDINCGGIDNIYRHHDYNIAIMESLTGKEYARYYLHGEHLIVEGKTMSKSRGNILYPEHVYREGFTPEELRYFLTSSQHYRKKLNFTWKSMENAAENLRKIRELIKNLTSKNSQSPVSGSSQGLNGKEEKINMVRKDFEYMMEDDLNLMGGIESIHKNLRELSASFSDGLDREGSKKLIKVLQNIDTVTCCLL